MPSSLVVACAGGIQDLLRHDICSGTPDAWGKDGLLMAKEPEMKVAFKQLQVVLSSSISGHAFCWRWLRAGRGTTLHCVLGILITNRQLPLLTRGHMYSKYVRIVMWHSTET